MSTMWRRAMLYLGLGPDEEYEDGNDDSQRAAPPASPSRPPAHSTPNPPVNHEGSDVQLPGNVRAITPQPLESNSVKQRSTGSVVRPIPAAPNTKPHVIAPASFDDAQEVGDKFKGNVPVIVNLQEADRDLSRRLIDFCSGLCYGLGGDLSRVAQHVFLLTPSNVEVSAEDRRRLQERGLYD